MDPELNLYNVHSVSDDLNHDVRFFTDFSAHPFKDVILHPDNVAYIHRVTGDTEMNINDAITYTYTQEVIFAADSLNGALDIPSLVVTRQMLATINAMIINELRQRQKQRDAMSQARQRDEDAWANYDLIPNRPTGVNYQYKRPTLDLNDNIFI